MRLLMRFSKGDEVKYISHLDIQRLFQRALRRAKLSCAYSQGFNPHMLISFACALPVGVCSNAEYVEVQLEKYVHPLDAMRMLNDVLPNGVRILNATEPKEGYPNVGSVIALAGYSFVPESIEGCTDKLKELMAQNEIIIEKRTKKGMANVNVRPMIHRLALVGDKIEATLSCSNSENMRADKLAEMLENTGIKIKSAVRETLYIINESRLEEPLGAKP